MKKVLFVATVFGHIQVFHLPYLKLFKENGYKTFVSSNYNGRNGEKLDYTDVFYQIPIQRNPISIKNIKAILELKKIIQNEKFEIIHCHTPMGGVVARLAAKKSRKKNKTRIIYTAHGFHFFKGASLKSWMIYFPVEWFLAKFTDTIITINREDYLLAKKYFGNRCRDIQYVPGVGVDEKKFNIEMSEKEKNELKKSLGLKNDTIVLSCVARLDKNKNQEFLINSMKRIIEVNSNIHLLLIGPDELDNYYQELVNKLELSNNIHFLGKRDDIPRLLKITNVVVSASKREGLGLNLIESIASNVPVVASHNRGHDEIVVDGQNGYFFTNEADFCSKVLKIINNNQKYSNILNTVKKFDLKNTVSLMKKIYKL